MTTRVAPPKGHTTGLNQDGDELIHGHYTPMAILSPDVPNVMLLDATK
jgi:hypothetical protein